MTIGRLKRLCSPGGENNPIPLEPGRFLLKHQYHLEDLQWRMGVCWRIREAARAVCPQRVAASCPQRIRPALDGGGAGNRDVLEEGPPSGPVTESPLPPVLCERCRLKRRNAKKRDDAEALGVVIHLPNATAAIHENPEPGV